jgi:acyl transferase domain-containing protein/thioesterase domain-containing protein
MNSVRDKIAVIGVACRYPGAKNKDEYWNNLLEGKETIKFFTDEELAKSEYDFENLKTNSDYIRARGIINDVDKFDADFFGMNPKEAAFTDPQQRVWLETAWEALEDAGCDPFTYPGAIGVFAGSYINTYLLNNILRDRTRLENYIRLRGSESYQILTGNDVSFLPTKTAYKFNLHGPAINVQTACSTSLVAISQACQSLFSFESDICLAGGVCIVIPQETGYLSQAGAIQSPDGKCRPFDAKGNGTVFSNGAGVVILKRAEDAIRDKDVIYALVSGWALNNDGNDKVSYTAPSVEGQATAITMAHSFAGISPEQIAYIEAHGTATRLGDPIELTALNKVFSAKTDKKQFCGIGSVKSNIGHTDAAAGVASFIKACLSVYNKTIPASLNFTEPNPNFDFRNSPFFVQDKTQKWESSNPLIIGVSSFGIGGTNSHVIVEEPPVPGPSEERSGIWPELLLLSAKKDSALIARKNDLIRYMNNNPQISLADVAFTLGMGRNHMEYRSFAVAEDGMNLDSFSSGIRSDDQLKGMAFLFPGQGAQYSGMGKSLYQTNSHFRQIADQCFNIFRSETGMDMKEIIFNSDTEISDKLLSGTEITQPALFITEYALAAIYSDFGIRPDFMIGHSIGEYVAACISGVFDLPSALKIVIRRGQLMSQMPKGSMMAVRTNIEKLQSMGSQLFEIAGHNSENQCTISIRPENVEKVRSLLVENEIRHILLNTSHAFHSSAFDPILDEFSSYVNQFEMNDPRIPFISCLTGDFITSEQARSGLYWAQQLRNTVSFRNGISKIASVRDVLFLEVGPDTHLSGFIKQNIDVRNKDAIVCSLGKRDELDERRKIMASLGNIWANGINPDFHILFKDGAKKIHLPVYPFQRERYWYDFISMKESADEKPNVEPILPVSHKVLTDELKGMIADIVGLKGEIKEDQSFDRIGLDSLSLAVLAQNISKKYKIKIEFRQLASELTTIDKLSKALKESLLKSGVDQNDKRRKNGGLNNFIRYQPHGEKHPLVVIHGERADRFFPEFLGKDQPYYGYLHPGSDGEKISFRSVEEMVQSYLSQLISVRNSGPFYLAGYSFGGILAFEMAVQLKKLGIDVPFVLLFDTYACDRINSLQDYLLLPPRKVLNLIRTTISKSYIRTGRPNPVNLREYYIIDKYIKLQRAYSPAKSDVKLVLFRATENKSYPELLGWEKFTDNITVIPLEGDHSSIFTNEKSIKKIQTETMRLLNQGVLSNQ